MQSIQEFMKEKTKFYRISNYYAHAYFKRENVEFALRRKDLREEFLKYLIKVVGEELKSVTNDEAAFSKEE